MLRRQHRPKETQRPDSELREWVDGTGDLVVAVLVYEGASTADVELPTRRLSTRLGAAVRFVALETGPHHGIEPGRDLIASARLADLPAPDLLVIPGGLGWRQLAANAELIQWLESAATTAQGVLTVSTGSLVLAATGWLDGTEVAGHWLGQEQLAELGAEPVPDGVQASKNGRLVSASGAIAGIAAADQLADVVLWS